MILRKIEIKRTFLAHPQQVFEAWTIPSFIKHWWCTPGYRFESLEIDLRPTGTYRYEIVPEEGKTGPTCVMEGQFSEIKLNEKLAYSWTISAADFIEAGTNITVWFKANGDSTDVILLHQGFATDEGFKLHELDWSIVLTNLEEFLQHSAVTAN